MTPREIIDKIKAHPAKERANEIMICNSIIEPLNDIHYSLLNAYQDTKNLYDKKSVALGFYPNSIQLNHLLGEMNAYVNAMECIREKINKYEWWIKEGNFGYIEKDFIDNGISENL
jgi:hypothetical protein